MRDSSEDCLAMREFTSAWVKANVKNPNMKYQALHLADAIEQGVLTLMQHALMDECRVIRHKMTLLCQNNLPRYHPEWQKFPAEIEASLSDLFDTGTRYNLTNILQLWAHVADGLKQATQ